MKRFYHKIDKITGPVVSMKANYVALGELACVHKKNGQMTLAEVTAISGSNVSLQVFSGSHGIRTDDQLEFLGHSAKLNFKKNYLPGRIFSGSGEPMDERPAIDQAEKINLAAPAFNPAKLRPPTKLIATHIPMIDMFNPLVLGQSMAIFALPNEPSNELLMRMALKADADIIIVGAMGIKHDDLSYCKDALALKRQQTIMFIHQAADPVVECAFIPDLALAAAEQYALLGYEALVLLTDMARYGDALREISVAMDETPSHRGYPCDLYSKLATKYEKATCLEGAGSITIMAVTTVQGDTAHPVPVNTAAITDGHLYVRNGAIDPRASLSRLRRKVYHQSRDDHGPLTDTMIRLYDQAKRAEKRRTIGFNTLPYDGQLLRFAREFEEKLMSLSASLPLMEQLNLGWQILSHHFLKEELDLPRRLMNKYWPVGV